MYVSCQSGKTQTQGRPHQLSLPLCFHYSPAWLGSELAAQVLWFHFKHTAAFTEEISLRISLKSSILGTHWLTQCSIVLGKENWGVGAVQVKYRKDASFLPPRRARLFHLVAPKSSRCHCCFKTVRQRCVADTVPRG